MSGIGNTDEAPFLTALIDTMIPGEGDFPSASEAGIVGLIARRALEMHGANFLAGLAEALDRDGAPFSAADKDERIARLQAHESFRPADIQALCVVLYLSYYGSAPAKAAIRRMGLQYPDAPQPGGYRMSLFNPSDPMEAPLHRRGTFVPTERVERVSVEGLGNLAERVG